MLVETRPAVDSWFPPARVSRPAMVHVWRDVAFLHWPYEPQIVQRLLPSGLMVDTFDGAAWIGIIPFRPAIRAAKLPSLPWLAGFPEVNLRTYVRTENGGSGIWFLSLEAPRLGAVVAARAWYHLPYNWAWLRFLRGPRSLYCLSRRRWPSPRGVGLELAVALDDPVPADDVAPVERFLMGRWKLYTETEEGLQVTDVEHEPWALWRGRLLHLQQDLTSAAALPDPEGAPLVHFSPGVKAMVSRRRPASAFSRAG
jgi:uncharacterized protein YqjF (DUF2071 family)